MRKFSDRSIMFTHMKGGLFAAVCFGVLAFLAPAQAGSRTFTVATYNIENYLEARSGTRPAKSAIARAKVRESIRAMSPDVLALQEIGATNALFELRRTLKVEGLDYPHWEHVRGFDTNIFVAVLSRFPIITRRSVSNASFLLQGRRYMVSRGFADVDILAPSDYTFTLITAHLKSRREVPQADQAELREQEARLLRAHVNALLARDPTANLVVLGDFNDSKSAPALKTILGTGKTALVDTRPAERSGEEQSGATGYIAARKETWTHFYAKEDLYQRVDYILLSSGMAREWDRTGTYVLALPGWGVGSDHRPLIARFFAENR